ncbi:hypothetical protein JJB99_28360 [Bradyrhizobium diazoefficiens]|uniref:hypothetical protein n=1 Tax=Bradyrhizobium diazoefficiens TaxID=1355477 RepID=UPI00190A6518|nr:hypothetical protein [Bradyrhizobium diazoefficiens]QQO13287.1 hypothetical protein JJB99_28360 [Bradyrhizobium diazoefficiens]
MDEDSEAMLRDLREHLLRDGAIAETIVSTAQIVKQRSICRRVEARRSRQRRRKTWIALPSVPQSSRIRRDLSRGRGADALNAVEQSSSFSPSSSGAPQCRHMRTDNDGALPLATI